MKIRGRHFLGVVIESKMPVDTSLESLKVITRKTQAGNEFGSSEIIGINELDCEEVLNIKKMTCFLQIKLTFKCKFQLK